VGQGDVTHAAPVEVIDQARVAPDGITVLHADENGALALFFQAPGVGGGQGPAAKGGVFFVHRVHGVQDGGGFLLRPRMTLRGARTLADEDGEERGVEPALLHARQVLAAAAALAGLVVLADIPAFFEELEWSIAMGVDGERPLMPERGLRLRPGLGKGRGHGACQQRRKEQNLGGKRRDLHGAPQALILKKNVFGLLFRRQKVFCAKKAVVL